MQGGACVGKGRWPGLPCPTLSSGPSGVPRWKPGSLEHPRREGLANWTEHHVQDGKAGETGEDGGDNGEDRETRASTTPLHNWEPQDSGPAWPEAQPSRPLDACLVRPEMWNLQKCLKKWSQDRAVSEGLRLASG